MPNKKPEPRTKPRKCLTCPRIFQSTHIGNRLCAQCNQHVMASGVDVARFSCKGGLSGKRKSARSV